MSFNSNKFLQLLCLLLITSNVYTQTYTKDSMDSSAMAGSLGWGVVVCIIALIIGIVICIFGLSTVIPGVFIAIGFCIPLFFFIFFSFCPIQDLSNVNQSLKNPNWNVFIIWRWLYFSVMLVMLFAVFAPFWILWNVTIMPQRVDSRAQKKHDEEYQAFLKEEKRNAEREILEQQQQVILPGSVLELHQNNNNNNNTNNNIDNRRGEGYLQQPIQQSQSILPVARTDNNVNKFAGLKRKTHNQENQP